MLFITCIQVNSSSSLPPPPSGFSPTSHSISNYITLCSNNLTNCSNVWLEELPELMRALRDAVHTSLVDCQSVQVYTHCTYIPSGLPKCAGIHTLSYTHRNTDIRTFIHTHWHTHTHTLTHTLTYTHIDIHTQWHNTHYNVHAHSLIRSTLNHFSEYKVYTRSGF